MRALRGVAVAAFATCVAAPSAAHAEPGVDWMRIVLDLDTLARRGADALDSPRCASTGCGQPRVRTPALEPHDPNPQNAGNAWFGVAPRVSLVARDWASAYRVAGDRLALVDAVRLSSSTRMVLSRVRLSDRRFTPFAQVGLGQWRVDTNVMPLTRRYMEIAAQVGGGLEVRLSRRWQVAAESTITLLHADGPQPAEVAVPLLWSTMLASRLEF